MNSLTISQFQENFDIILERVQSGETFYIRNKDKNFMLLPCNHIQETDEFIRIHKDHEEGC